MTRFQLFLVLLACTPLLDCGEHHSYPALSAKTQAAEADKTERSQEIRVEPVQVARAPLEEVVAPGKIEANPGTLSKVALPMAGRVVRVLVTVGDAVHKGKPVLMLESPDTGAAVSNYRQARAKVAQAKSEIAKAEADLSRVQDLLAHGAVAQKDVLSEQAQLAQAQSDLAQAQAAEEESGRKLRIFGISEDGKSDQILVPAPVSGKVLDLSVTAGEYRNDTSAPVMTLADLNNVYMTADVPEASLRLVRIGQAVKIRLDAYPNEVVTGRVARIGDTVDPTTRTIKVRVSLANPTEKFRPDMFGQLQIEGASQEMVSIPAGAVVQTAQSPTVYRERAAGQYQPIPVTLGERSGDRVFVVSGLSKTDRIVTDGTLLVRSNVP